ARGGVVALLVSHPALDRGRCPARDRALRGAARPLRAPAGGRPPLRRAERARPALSRAHRAAGAAARARRRPGGDPPPERPLRARLLLPLRPAPFRAVAAHALPRLAPRRARPDLARPGPRLGAPADRHRARRRACLAGPAVAARLHAGGLGLHAGRDRPADRLPAGAPRLPRPRPRACAAAGLCLGGAVARPGRQGRRRALREAVNPALLLFAGSIPLFALAALAESFVRESALGTAPRLGIAVVFAAGLVASLIAVRRF